MADELSIKISANTADLKAADNELVIMEKSVGRLNSELQKNKSGWGSVTSAVTAASTAFLAVNQAVTQYVIAPLQQAVTSFMAFGDSLSKTAQRVGIGVESLGALKFAAEQCGANFDILTDGIKKFQNQLGAANMGDASAINKLGNVGLSPDAFAGLTEEDQLMKLADHIKAIGDKSEQTRVAMELFGKAGFKLLPFFQEGSEGMKTSTVAISNVIIANFAPSLSSGLDSLTALMKGISRFVKDNAVLVSGIGAAVAALSAWNLGLLTITTALPALITGIKALGIAVAANPLLAGGAAAVALIAGAFAAWNRSIEETEKRLYSVSEAASKHREEVDKAQAADKALFDRLEELASIEDPLSNEEIEEANSLIAALTDKYGDLGIEIDKDTGKIKGLAEAQAKMLDAQKADKNRALQNEIDEANANIEKLQRKIANKHFSIVGKLGGWEREFLEDTQSEIDLWTQRKANAIRAKAALNPELYDDGTETEEVTAPASLDAQKKASTAEREARNSAKSELAGMKADTDLMSPMEKSLYELDQKYQQKVANLEKKIAATEKAGGDASSLYAQYAQIDAWRQGEIAKIGQQHTDAQDKAWKEAHPARDRLETRDARIVSAEAQVQSAKQAQADAILSGSGLAEADALLQTAEEALARTIAEVSGEERQKAKADLDAATAKLQKAERDGANTKTLNELTAAVRKAQDAYTKANDSYFNAVGSLRQETEEQTAEAVQTTLASSGTFSAYGVDAAVTADIPQRTLEAILKILDNTDEMKEEQKNEGAYTK